MLNVIKSNRSVDQSGTKMGNYISNNSVYLLTKRILMRYNVENRAFKEMDRQAQRPAAAPKHEAAYIDYHKAMQENTEYTDVSTKLDPILDDRLKGVYVTSKGMTESIKNIKPMPQKGPTVTHALGYKDCDNVGPGRLSLLQAMKILTDRQSNPAIWPVTKIAEVNNIQVEHAQDIINYYQAFNAQFKDKGDQKKIGNINQNLLGAKLVEDSTDSKHRQ